MCGDIPGLGMLDKLEPNNLTVLGLSPSNTCSALHSGLWLTVDDVADDADMYRCAPITVKSGSEPILVCTGT
jgi:hypothetical protein